MLLYNEGHSCHWIYVSIQSPNNHSLSTNDPSRILGVVINCAGTPDSGYIGGRYWADPGAFNGGFKGFANILVTAAFSFAGTELVGLAAAETANPSRALPTAIKQVFWRIAVVCLSRCP